MNFNNSRFKVQIGELEIACSSVRNLVFNVAYTTTQVGTDKTQSVKHLLGNKTFPPVILERPLKSKDSAFFDFWKNGNVRDEKDNMDITIASIQLLDKDGNPVATWKLSNPQFPQLSYSDFDAKGNEILTEKLEIIHEGIEVEMQ